MKNLQFKIDGPILKTGIPLPLVTSALSSFQNIVDKSYLIVTNTSRITSNERKKFYIKATEFKHGSFIAYFEIVLQSVQLVLPLVSSFGPQNIWDLTRDSFSMLKLVCGAVRSGKQPTYEFKDNGDVSVQVGDVHHHYHGPVFQISQLSLSHFQDLAHLIGDHRLTEISAGHRLSSKKDIYLGKKDKNIFDIPSEIKAETIKLECEIFTFNKYKNSGKLSVSVVNQGIPPGEYNFTIVGDQDNVNYIFALLKPQVVLSCLIEESLNPFGEINIKRLHIAGVVDT